MNKTTSWLFIVLMLMSAPALGQPKSWGLVKGDAVNVHPDFVDVARVLLEQHLSEEGITVLPASEGETAAALWAKGVEAVVRFSVVRMGENVKISVQKLGPDGTVLAASNMTAASPDDLDAVTARLARHLVSGQKPEEGQSIYEVTDREQEKLKKKRSTYYYSLRVLGATSFTSGLDQFPMKYGAGFSALYDPRAFLAELFTNMYGGSEDDFSEFSWELGVGGYYPLTDLNFCPYVGGTLSLTTHSAEWNGRSWHTDEGLTVGLAAGVLLGRTSDIAARIEFRFLIDTFTVDNDFSSGLMGFAPIGF